MRIKLSSHIILLGVIVFVFGCKPPNGNISLTDELHAVPRGALMTTRIYSMDELKKIIDIEYTKGDKLQVVLRHVVGDKEVISVMGPGLNQNDFTRAKMGTIWDKFKIGLKSPFGIANREDLLKAYMLARRKFEVYGEGDVAMFDIAEQMVKHISKTDKEKSSKDDLGEKGYLNTFNHFIAQSIYTAIFSEEMADFIADTHERNKLPELLSGDFTEEQLNDIENGAVDNYVDMINNEWGQEFGKLLKKKYNISKETVWTPELLANYFNDVQDYFTAALDIDFSPFKPSDERLRRFSIRTNLIMDDASLFMKNTWYLKREKDVISQFFLKYNLT